VAAFSHANCSFDRFDHQLKKTPLNPLRSILDCSAKIRDLPQNQFNYFNKV